MKYLLPVLIVFAATFNLNAQNGYKYTFKIKGLKDTSLYLAKFQGKGQYWDDTTTVNSKGVAVFEGSEPQKPGGVYVVILPDKKSVFQVVINESEIELETHKDDLMGKMKIKKSKENNAFYKYMSTMNNLQPEIQELVQQRNAAEDDKKRKSIQQQLDKKRKEAKEFTDQFFEENNGLLVTKILKASQEPEIPKEVRNDPDSTLQYKYYKKHYFDHIDLSDDRMLRTPIIHNKLETYLTKVIPQIPDTICKEIEYLVNQTAGDSSEMFRYIVQFAVNKYEKSKMMGMDAVFVCIAEKYYMQGKGYWLSDDQFENIAEHYEKRKRQIIGTKAENIILPDLEGNWRSLYDIDADYTVLIFWDPKCGHCKKEMPKLGDFYDEWKSKGVEIYAVSTALENKDWEKFIRDKEITDWINTSDTPEINENATQYIRSGQTTLNSLNFRDYWDIFSTPQLYVLDKNKKIIAKRLGAEQLPDFLNQHMKKSKSDGEGEHIEMQMDLDQ